MTPNPPQGAHTLDSERPSPENESPLQQQVSLVLDRYLTMLESGVPVSDDGFLAQYEDIAEELRPHLKMLRTMKRALGENRNASPMDRDASFEHVSTYRAPQQLGIYSLQREIGRGGQGIVYEAHDETLNRRVALKVLPFAALLDPRQIDRFNNEAQAAARLHHPNIVPVFAVGVDRGVHFYAMQYVEGAPLSVAIEQLRAHGGTGNEPEAGQDAQRRQAAAADSTAKLVTTHEVAKTAEPATSRGLSVWIGNEAKGQRPSPIGQRHFRDVARLGIELADGLAHAHELGIVHRDIKPSNLLLDESGKAWIADFGLARIPNDNTMTGSGDILGTIRYMSPEQARGRNSFVDHRTDIYSLGITLYELLTLQPVFGSKDREEFMASIGVKQPTRPRRIDASIPADLENIILRAIELDPADRYASATLFRDDLQRFLQGKPTLAKRASLSDCAFKWAKRHRRIVSVAAISLLFLTGGLATATWLIANEQSKTSAALHDKELSLERANANFEATRELVNELGVDTIEALAGIPGAEQVRRSLLLKTKGYYDFLLKQTDDELLLHDRGVALTRSARVNEQLGDIQTARELYAAAGEELEVAIRRNPDNDDYRAELFNCRNNEAMLLAREGQLDLAATLLGDAVRAQQRLLDQSPEHKTLAGDLACSQANLAYVLQQCGKLEESKSAYTAAIDRYREHQLGTTLEAGETQGFDNASLANRRQFALALHNLSALLARDDPARAEMLCSEAISAQQQLLREGNHDLRLKGELAICLDRRAELQSLANKTAAAEISYQNAITIQRQLVSLAPDDLTLVEDLAITLNHLGELYRNTESYQQAETLFGEAAELLRRMANAAPQQIAFRSSLGAVLYNQGAVRRDLDDEEGAWQLWNEGLAHQQAAVDQAPQVASYRQFLDQQKASLQNAYADRLAEQTESPHERNSRTN